MPRYRVVGICFEHFHMGDNLRAAFEHPEVEVVGICDDDPKRTEEVIRTFSIPSERVFTDPEACLDQTKPDIVILCPATAGHRRWCEQVAPSGAHVIMEKPFAASLADADQMTRAMESGGGQLFIHWPMAWMPSHRTAHRLTTEGRIGEVIEVHYYDGNRGPLWHTADKIERSPEDVEREKPNSWFYQRKDGGGSLLDYLGYGTTLGTWFMDGRKPIEVTTTVDQPDGLDVDEHSVTVARYATGLSKFETRWGTFTDPWTHPPQPACGFVIVGTDGTITSLDYAASIRMQTRQHPEGLTVRSEPSAPQHQNAIANLIHSLDQNRPVEDPCSIRTSRIGQEIVDAAIRSAAEKRTVAL